MRKLALMLSLLALGALGLTSCGGGNDDDTIAASAAETPVASEADPARKPCRPFSFYRLAVDKGDISCRGGRRVILDLANNRLPGSWSCTGLDADVVCTKEPGASSTIVITAHFDSEAAAVEADPGTILSDEEVIGRKANDWAGLFAMDALAACRYYAGGQPACERAGCQRVGHPEPIRNCAPPSSEFRESFADATVERVAVSAPGATAEFSNGESVQFHAGKDERWHIAKRWIKDSLTRSRSLPGHQPRPG
jgi:hypothetical protein